MSQPGSRQTASMPSQLRLVAIVVFAIGSIYGGILWMSSAPRPVYGTVLQPSAPTPSVPEPAPMISLPGGSALPVPGADSNVTARFVLAGVVSDVPGGGVALIAVDGEAAKPYAVGTELAPGYVLQSISEDQAKLAKTLQSPVNAVLMMKGEKPGGGTPAATPVSRPQVAAAMVDTTPALVAAVGPEIPAGPAARQDSRYRSTVIRRH